MQSYIRGQRSRGPRAQTQGSGVRRSWPPGGNTLSVLNQGHFNLKTASLSSTKNEKVSISLNVHQEKKISPINLKIFKLLSVCFTLAHQLSCQKKFIWDFLQQDERSEQAFWPIRIYYVGLFLPLGALQNKARNHWLCYSLRISLLTLEADPLTLISLLKLCCDYILLGATYHMGREKSHKMGSTVGSHTYTHTHIHAHKWKHKTNHLLMGKSVGSGKRWNKRKQKGREGEKKTLLIFVLIRHVN